MLKMDRLNVLPVPTFRWLKVNELKIDDNIDFLVKPYNKEYLKVAEQKDFLLTRKSDNELIDAKNLGIQDESMNPGVSKDLMEFGENHFNSGIYLNVPEDVVITEPIIIKYELDDENNMVVDNNIIIADRYSKVTVIIDISSDQQAAAMHNGVTKIIARDGAEVNIIKVQRMNNHSFHFDSNIAILDGNAKVNQIDVELGSKKAVVSYVQKLSRSSEGSIDSVYLGDSDRHIDLNYIMEHIGRRSISKIDVRGVLKDRATKTFKGTIDFKKGASQADGSEEENVILFDKTVKSDSVPLLLCAEDDVKGQHAVSTGKVDKDKLFYLMSRGFSKEEGMKLLVEASFSNIVDKIPLESLREIIDNEIHRRLVYES